MLLLLPLLAFCASASPHSNHREGRPPPLRNAQAVNPHEHLLPPQVEEVETMLPVGRNEDTLEILPFEPAEFDLYEDGYDGIRTHLSFDDPEANTNYAIDPRRDNMDAFIARRRAADRAHRRGEYLGNYQLDRANDQVRHQAMFWLSTWQDSLIGSGAVYDLDRKIIYANKNMSNQQAATIYRLGKMAVIYTDQSGILHIVTRYDSTHPGPFNNYTDEHFNADEEYRRVSNQLL